MTPPRQFASRCAAAVLMCLLVTSCGLPAQDEPQRVDLPRRPLTSAGPPAAGTERPGEIAAVLCLVRDGRLVQTIRRVTSPPSVQRHLEHLVAGPTEAERATGLTTALATTTLRVDLPAGSTEARVDIAEPDDGSARSDDTVGYGQIVCTLTSRADVSSVILTRGGEVLQVPRADGSLSRGPLRANDYASLIAPS